ncbi:hypothetical protein [Nesterenkonia pannonica]|uniref:hypothetical protein n=1 Tax=Nesterenkonia pannonica TaxID=1548602 RepID=UPI0021642CFF|nr:hypothetical protein [Nesterenkonia pannonica]
MGIGVPHQPAHRGGRIGCDDPGGPRNVYDASRRWDAISSAQALVGMGAAVLAIKTWAEAPIDYPWPSSPQQWVRWC